MHIYLRNKPAQFHTGLIWNDGLAIRLFEEVAKEEQDE